MYKCDFNLDDGWEASGIARRAGAVVHTVHRTRHDRRDDGGLIIVYYLI
jgi:hypothetical protein